MALQCWFESDIRNALLAAGHSVDAAMGVCAIMAGQPDGYAAGFASGYHAALVTLALAFGLVLRPGQPVRGLDRGRAA